MALRTQVSPYVLLGDSLADLPDPGSVAQGMLFHEDATGQGRVLVIDPATGLRTWEPFNAPAGPTGATGATGAPGPATTEVLVAPAVDQELVVPLPDVTTQPDGALTLYVLVGAALSAAVGVLTAQPGQTVGAAGLDWYRLYEGATVLLRATPAAARWDVAGETRSYPATLALAIEVYADATAGSDANPGTAARPVRTLQRAEQLYPPAVVTTMTIHLAPGAYGDPAGILQLGGAYPAGPAGTALIIEGAFRDAGYGAQAAQAGSGGFTLATALDLPPGTDLAGAFVSLPNSGSTDLKAVARNTTGPGATLTLADAPAALAPGDPFVLLVPAVNVAGLTIASGTRLIGFYGVRFTGPTLAAVYGGTIVCDTCVFQDCSPVAFTSGTLSFTALAAFPSPWTGGPPPPGSTAPLSPSALLGSQPAAGLNNSRVTGALIARVPGVFLGLAAHSNARLDFVDAAGGGIDADGSSVDLVPISGGAPAMRIAAGAGNVAVRARRGSTVAAEGSAPDGVALDGEIGVYASGDSAVRLADVVLAGCVTMGVLLTTGSALRADRVRCAANGDAGVALSQAVANLDTCVVTGNASHGIAAANNARVIVANSDVSDNGGDGVHATNASNGEVSNTTCGANAGHGVALSGGCQFDLANLSGAGNGGYGLDVEYRSGATAAGCAAAGAAGEVRLGAAGALGWAAIQTPDGANDLAPVAPFTVAQLCFASEP